MDEKNSSCLFTGHRRLPAGRFDALKRATEEAVCAMNKKGVFAFLCGGAMGFDLLAGEAVLGLRAGGLAVKLHMVLPCRQQHDGWPQAEKARHDRLVTQADSVVCLSEDYFNGCMKIRNQYMVNRAAHCIAYLEHLSGGTFYTVSIARLSGLEIVNLATLI